MGRMRNVGLQVPEEVLDLLREVARDTERSMTEELIRAIIRHHKFRERKPVKMDHEQMPDNPVDHEPAKRGRKPRKKDTT